MKLLQMLLKQCFKEEFVNKYNITLYSTQNEGKSSVIERWNRTIKTKMWKQFTVKAGVNMNRREI